MAQSTLEQEVCALCGKVIPAHVIESRHYSLNKLPKHIFCDGKCRDAFLRQAQHYKRISAIGKQARSVAVAESNAKNPRRKGKI